MSINHDNEADSVTMCMPLQLLRSIDPRNISSLTNMLLGKNVVPRLVDYRYLEESEWLDLKGNVTLGDYSHKKTSTFKVSDWGVDLFDVDKVVLLTTDRLALLYHRHVQYVYLDECCEKSKEVNIKSSAEEVFRNFYSPFTPLNEAQSIALDFDTEANRIFS
jgi:hypothetical protein